MFAETRKVDLSGRRGKGKLSKEEILEKARRQREQRAADNAPQRAAVIMQRLARGRAGRDCAARMLCAAIDCVLAAQQPLGEAAAPSLSRRLGLLWCVQPRQPEVAARAEACGRALLPTACRCVCGQPSAAAEWSRRHARLLPALLHAASLGGTSAAELAFALTVELQLDGHGSGAARWPACCRAKGAQLARELVRASAHELFRAIGLVLLPPAGSATPDAAASLGRTVDRLAYLARSLLRAEPAAPLFSAFVAHLPPLLLLLRPPPPALRPAVRTLYAEPELGAGGRLLAEAVAADLARWAADRGLVLGGRLHEGGGVLLDALAACAAGSGSDWHEAGWTEGAPRRLTTAELNAIMDGQVVRLQQQLAAGSGAPREPPQPAEVLMMMLRSGWDVAKAARSLEHPTHEEQPPPSGVCGICFEAPAAPSRLLALSCGHGFCSDCWGLTLKHSIERGPACVHERCPMPDCELPVSAEIWSRTLPAVGAARLKLLALRSFVTANRLLCWCPGARCGRAAALVNPDAPPQLACACRRSFCVLCGEEPHWPTSCERRQAWTDLLNQSSDTATILKLTRPCPSCGVRTQRNAGCLHISCTQCSTEWCWGCGEMGKSGVHHASETCSRKPNPNWKFETEEKKLADGSFAAHLDEFYFRNEQIEAVQAAAEGDEAAQPGRVAATAGGVGAAAGQPEPMELDACGECEAPDGAVTPSSLRPLLLRALSALRWAQVYLYYCPSQPDALPARTRVALSELGVCTDLLFARAGFGTGPAGAPGAPDWAALAEPETAARVAWLGAILHYLQTAWRPGPAAAAPPERLVPVEPHEYMDEY